MDSAKEYLMRSGYKADWWYRYGKHTCGGYGGRYRRVARKHGDYRMDVHDRLRKEIVDVVRYEC